ncbi:MAG: aldo/keto reductase [Phycisphaerae bacterium]|jgi:aryl-alcohol dehydrogenase-like predicted oxidoreductase
MNKVPLGTTGVAVSEFCLGTMHFGGKVDEPTSWALMDLYVEAGGSFLDTANIYGRKDPESPGGGSETVIGRWLRQRGHRDTVFLASKVGFPCPGVEGGLAGRVIQSECEKSLERLGVETIDLYYAHRDDRAVPLEETLAAMDKLVRQGKVRYVGVSNCRAWRIQAARNLAAKHDYPPYCCVQQRYTYLRPGPGADFTPQVAADEDLLDFCRAEHVTLMAYTPLLKGAYTQSHKALPSHYVWADSTVRLAALRALAQEKGITPNQLVLAWIRRTPAVTVPVFSVSGEEQLRENLGALEVHLSDDELKRLDPACP